MNSIYNYHLVSNMLACSGQPREAQLPIIAAEGYRVIINLGLADGKYALTNEHASAKQLGITYHHIPVQFDDPQINELIAFFELMNRHKGDKKLVHCAANYRASAFTGLYLFSIHQLDEDRLISFIEDVWQPDPVWQQFIEESIEFIKTT
ncbi:protein tyrosine phosphatase family protein [Mucilaginibacter sp.]|uniref:protein tyrosine phosphatase family protein n=1 Tax=Mucilaginibacter sp. TaxID=1882438 RepID=UPI00283C4001|nr:protein tyrosine phosphatase family protein [Mucilaginibacter sp.]MDR3694346.1 protein tyrosine phosphatase family protein [Mucilaginibacter sp.]